MIKLRLFTCNLITAVVSAMTVEQNNYFYDSFTMLDDSELVITAGESNEHHDSYFDHQGNHSYSMKYKEGSFLLGFCNANNKLLTIQTSRNQPDI